MDVMDLWAATQQCQHIVSSPRKTCKTWTVNQRVLIDIAYHHRDSAFFANDISQ